SHDRRVADRSAKSIGLDLVEVEIEPNVVWEFLPRVIWAIESSKLMDVEIALPFFLAAQRASDDGLTIMVSGQGPDELFAGYSRHLRIYQEEGPDSLTLRLWEEVSRTHEVNIERDERAIASHGLRAFFPYLENRFVRLALTMPASWKIHPEETPSRKIVFRELARFLGLPEAITKIPKRATQYSSGSSSALQEAVSRHVKNASNLGRKKIVALTQSVLDRLSCDMGMPVEKSPQKIEFRTEPILPKMRE
ncbi:MAG: asparagine synthase C-terminal domain-containing protein, partial [Candidatus Thorarchaeota archaeon]